MKRHPRVDRAGVSVSVSDLADRLALTSRDRRLESMVLLEMIRAAERGEQPGPPRASADAQDDRDGAGPIEDSTYARALSLASFLSAEYGLQTLEQRALIAELAVEVAGRIADELPGV